MTGRRTLSNASLAPWQYLSIEEQRFRRIVRRFRGGLVCKAHRILYHLTLGLRVMKKKMELELEHDARPGGEQSRCRANMAHIRLSMPKYGLDFQVKVLKPF